MRFLQATVTAVAVWASATLALPSQRNTYAGAKVYRIPTGNQNQTAKISSLIDTLGLPAWTTARIAYSHIDVQVSKENLAGFHNALKAVDPALDSQLITMHEDLGESILKEAEGMNTPYVDAFGSSRLLPKAGLANDAWFNAYHTYADHLTFLSDLAATFPNNAKVVTGGTSYQGRAITGINIFGSSGSGTKPAVIFHGTVHAREWITTLVTEQIAYSLLSNYSTSSTIKSYVDKYDFYIFPVVNPDGFAYTQSTERLWRKNRQPPPSGSCYGRDINRNWPWKWDVAGGSSTDPCSETYRGATGGDSPENKGLAAFINSKANSAVGAKLYIDFHSYGLYFMGPYGYSCSANAADKTEHTKLEQGFAAAFKAPYGKVLKTGPICSTIYAVSGGSVDYAYDVSKIKYSFTPELRGGSSGSGFVLPPAEIRPSGIEAYEGIKYLLANIV
ncbi:putative carboxypeptidase [Ceratobasidium sp. AG-I]|nr:putative carboxypeptidase [Ceratobasidium sp. AG-I]